MLGGLACGKVGLCFNYVKYYRW